MIQFKPYNEPVEFLLLNKPLGKSITLKSGESIKAEVIDILPNGGVVVRLKGQHVAIKTEIPLQKDTTLLLKVMDSSNPKNAIKLQLISTQKDLNIKDISFKDIDTLLKVSQKIDKSFLLKEVINQGFLEEIKDFSKELNLFLNILKNGNLHKNILNRFENFFINFSKINKDIIKESIINSGVFLEAKLKNKKDIKDDLKTLLMDIYQYSEDKDIKKEANRFLNILENFQFLSILLDGVYTFLPLIEENLDNLEFILKKGKKEQFFFKIVLNFDDIKRVETSIFMFLNDLKIVFNIENSDFKKKIYQYKDIIIKELKRSGFENIFISFDENLDIKKIRDFNSIVDIKV